MYIDYGEDHYIATTTVVAEVESECKIWADRTPREYACKYRYEYSDIDHFYINIFIK